MANYEDNENDIRKEEQAETNQQMNEEEKKTAHIMNEKGMSKEEAEKESAKEKVEEKTGVNADELAGISQDVLMMKDGLERPDLDSIQKGINDLTGGKVRDVLNHLQDSKVADDIVKAGLGSNHASTGSMMLTEGAKTVLETGLEYSKGSKLGEMLADACDYGKGIKNQNEDNNEKAEQKNKQSDIPSYILNQYKNQRR